MSWPPKIEMFRSWVLWECKDIPPDLVLAIIKHESAGIIGRKASIGCKCGDIPDVSGKLHRVCHAYGLMQVIPATVNWYNQNASQNEKATYEDVTGEDERAARIQIRIGCAYLAFINHWLNQKFPAACPAKSLSEATNDQIALVITAYAVGHGATAQKLRALHSAGKKMSFANIKKTFPTWGQNKSGKWINRPILFADVIVRWYQENKAESFDTDKPTELIKRVVPDGKGFGAFAAILFVAGSGWLINRWYSRRKKDENP